MGWFSTPKCPIHRTEYSIGTNGLEDYYYCKHCKRKLIKERDEKRQRDKETEDLKNRISELERRVLNNNH
jgi:hypothetical protein